MKYQTHQTELQTLHPHAGGEKPVGPTPGGTPREGETPREGDTPREGGTPGGPPEGGFKAMHACGETTMGLFGL